MADGDAGVGYRKGHSPSLGHCNFAVINALAREDYGGRAGGVSLVFRGSYDIAVLIIPSLCRFYADPVGNAAICIGSVR